MQDRVESVRLSHMVGNAKTLLLMASKAYDGTSTGLAEYNRYKRGLVALISVTFNESYEIIDNELSGYYPAEITPDQALAAMYDERDI